MDLLPSVDALQDHLVLHDRAVRQIMRLDEYIERLSENRTNPTACPPLHHLIRLAVAEGIKRMYKEYRLRKWLQVQEMANVVRRVLSHAGDEVSDRGLTSSQLEWQPAPTALPLLSPIMTPHRVPGTAILPYYTPTVASPVHQVPLQQQHPAGTNRELFPVEGSEVHEEVLECGEDMLDDSMGEESGYSMQDTDEHRNSHNTGHSVDSVPGVNSDSDVYISHIIAEDQQLYEEVSEDEDYESEDSGMEWDEEEGDENVAGMLFATEHLLPHQQSVREDVEMGDNGVGHMIFDRISAVWYTAQSQFYRID